MNVNKSGEDFSSFFIPDAGFEERVQNIGRVEVVAKPSKSIFQDMVIDPDFFDAKLAATKGQIQNILSPGEDKQTVTPPNYESEFEKKFPYYSEKFQKILQLKKSPNLQELLVRYTTILLHILEQFQIKGDRKNHVRFMLTLKKVLNEITTFEEGEIYTRKMLEKTSYIRTSGELQEEIELLYSIYYQNYVALQREIHKEDRERREGILHTIETLEHAMLGKNYRDDEYWGPQQPNFAQEISKKREELLERRNQRNMVQKKA